METFINNYEAKRKTKRHTLWENVPDEQWEDWKWQLSNRINSVEEISKIINLTDSEINALQSDSLFRVDITPYFISLLDPDDPNCPLRKQVIPTEKEKEAFLGMQEDSLGEDAFSPVKGITHRYPDRVLMLVTTQCASYCRYCTRSRLVGDSSKNYSGSDLEKQIEYIRNNPKVRDVLLSGGDPLVLPVKRLKLILSKLREIPHLDIVRIGSRTPIFNPFVVTKELCDMLSEFHPLWVNIHVNHDKEITPELREACSNMLNVGIPLGNQAVLLKGINDTVNIQRKLCIDLVKMRVRPYYLYQCDLVKGAGHFRTSYTKGIEIIEGLRGHISGYAVPTFVVDAPYGGGKIPVAPNYIVSQTEGKVLLRNFEGFMTVYIDPIQNRDIHTEEVIDEDEDVSVLKLLQGRQKTIIPQNYRKSKE
ncbi:KamA family radical SAM protein [Aquimarina sp. RZ0]|uniref:KamA family radical SAM protein n=1 Tax=Aquimarina sp. RZ0 TaxID=2607730 RepID=UPI0011F2468D|nr:KamA family radical SAM protein [Aquimarina sp. RZ0]KAA1243798.1 KamA family radical SAM protein [Aquimarina sp. RZ0]